MTKKEKETKMNMVYELRQLTGCGMKECYEAVTALIEALSRKEAVKMDIGRRIKIEFEEYSLRPIESE